MTGGARGYLLKDAGAEAIGQAVLTVAAGGTVLDAVAQDGLLAEMAVRGRQPRPTLSDRERQVLALTADGHSAAEVGKALHLTAATIKSHLQTAYDKLGVSDRAAAVAEALRRGLMLRTWRTSSSRTAVAARRPGRSPGAPPAGPRPACTWSCSC